MQRFSHSARTLAVSMLLMLGSVDSVVAQASISSREAPLRETLLQDLERDWDAAVSDGPVDLAESEILPLPRVDIAREMQLDEARVSRGRVAHYAARLEVRADPWTVGRWQPLSKQKARWTLRIASPGALSLSLAFSQFELAPGAELRILSLDGETLAGPFTAADNETHGRLWTPPLTVDDLVLSLDAPTRSLENLKLRLSRVHHGYAGFGQSSAEKSGPCQQDLICAEEEEWQGLGSAVGLVSIEGVRYCTGFLINNTAQDRRPFFVTAKHCGIHAKNADSVVVMWEHAAASCESGAEIPQVYRSFQTGAYLRASHHASDLLLLELDDAPNMEQGVVFLGWDRSFDDPLRGLAIHHPNTDRRRLAVTTSPIRTTDHLGDEYVARGDHLRVAAWDQGTTEGGSSGSPLLNEDLRVVGALHGGHAACGNREADWFGRLSAAWDDGHQPERRFRDWLDPLGTGAVVLDSLKVASPATDQSPAP